MNAMARPIDPTPRLEGEDAVALLRDLEQIASPSVIAARQRQAQLRLDRVFVETPGERGEEPPTSSEQ